jgi:hypothetical protein
MRPFAYQVHFTAFGALQRPVSGALYFDLPLTLSFVELKGQNLTLLLCTGLKVARNSYRSEINQNYVSR